MNQGPPEWLKIWGTDVAENDLLRFTPEEDGVRVVARDYPGPHTRYITLTLPDDTTTAVSKLAAVWVLDETGDVRRRVQMVIEAVPA